MAATPTSTDLFLDTAYAVALANARDAYHERAHRLAEEIEREQIGVVTTQAVLLEIGNALAAPPGRVVAVQLIQNVERSPKAEVVPVTDALFRRGFELYRDRPDKTWGLVDCLSFVVMRERGIGAALTADRHFEQAGFRARLRPPAR